MRVAAPSVGDGRGGAWNDRQLDFGLDLSSNFGSRETLDEVQAKEHAARNAARRDEVAVVDDALATAHMGSHSSKLIPVLMVGGCRPRADETGVRKPHCACAYGGQLAASLRMGAGERADGTSDRFRARSKFTGVPPPAGHDQPLSVITRGVCLHLEALRGAYLTPLVEADYAHVQPSVGEHLVRTKRIKRLASVEQQHVDARHFYEASRAASGLRVEPAAPTEGRAETRRPRRPTSEPESGVALAVGGL